MINRQKYRSGNYYMWKNCNVMRRISRNLHMHVKQISFVYAVRGQNGMQSHICQSTYDHKCCT